MVGIFQRSEHCTSDGRITPQCGRSRCPEIARCAAKIDRVGHMRIVRKVKPSRQPRRSGLITTRNYRLPAGSWFQGDVVDTK